MWTEAVIDGILSSYEWRELRELEDSIPMQIHRRESIQAGAISATGLATHPRDGDLAQHLGEQLRTALLDSVTHELRSPLTSIKASVTLLLENSKLQPSQHNELLTIINEETDRLNRLVGEAMVMAQLEAGVKLDLKPHAIGEIIDAAIKDCRTLLRARSVQVGVP